MNTIKLFGTLHDLNLISLIYFLDITEEGYGDSKVENYTYDMRHKYDNRN